MLQIFRRECDKLRKELTAQKEEDKRAALGQLAKMKDEEAHASKYGWEKKVSELLNEVRFVLNMGNMFRWDKQMLLFKC